jgi:hypothetical protein
MEYKNNPTIFKADTQTLHLRIESMLHLTGGKQYNNLKLTCFKTGTKNQRIDLAEFYLHYAKMRAMLERIRYMSNRNAYRGKTFIFKYTAEVLGADKKTLRNLEIRFTPAKKLTFMFSDGKWRDADLGSGLKMTGNLAFHLNLEYKVDPKNTEVLIPDQLHKFDEFILLGDTIDTLEHIYGKEIFKSIESTNKSQGE